VSNAPAVLFDAPGPKTRRNVRIGTIVAVVAALGLAVAVILRFAERGQLDWELWSPLLDPTSDEFALVWPRLLSGLVVTIQVAVVAMTASLLIGILLAVARLSLGRYGRLPVIGFIELLRGLPVIVTIFYVSILLPTIGVDMDDFWFLVIGLTAYNCVVFSEILRAGIVSLPRGQVEAGLAIGLTQHQTMRLVQLPQAFRAMLPALISQLIVIVKDTALGSIVLNGVDDLMRQANQMRVPLDNPLQMFLVVALIFITVNYALDRLAQYVQRRMSTSTAAKVEGETSELSSVPA